MSDHRCPDEGVLALYAGGDLDDQAASELRRHLPGCQRCGDLLTDFRGGQAWLARQREVPLNTALLDQFQERLARQLGQRRPPSVVMAWLARIWEVVRPVRQPLMLMGVAAWLAVVAVSAFSRPDAGGTTVAVGPQPVAARASATSVADETAAEGDSSEGDELLSEPDEASRLRIELATRDPDVRIIWFASNTAAGER